MLKSSNDIIAAAKKLSEGGKRPRISVAVAQDADVLVAVRSAYDDGICDSSLFGDEVKIKEAAEKAGVSLEGLDVIHQPDPNKAVLESVQLAADGKADAVMKGFVSTSTLLKGVLNKRFGLRQGPTLSHVAVLTIPGHDKLFMVTDGGMIVKPDLQQRIGIVKNALVVGRALNISPIKVAMSGASNTVQPSMPQTSESEKIAADLTRENIADLQIAGPVTVDAALSPAVAAKIGLTHPVAGDADVYVVGSIEECNITTKSMIIFQEAIFAGVIIGAKIPISLVSRTDPVIGKKTSLALACLVADYYRRTEGEG
ncbi:MAG: phosphate butyryltransferase [candidate division Zixibacteria bacterium]|nr:phosphate butyryltransferase [candidate division Zixibacteria bacterium]